MPNTDNVNYDRRINEAEAEIIPSHLQWLTCEAPGFPLCGDQIKVLFTPHEFYSAITNGCRESKSRIALAALYIGMGELEQKLVQILDDRMIECGQNLRVTILLDAVRGARDNSATTLLLPLIKKHQECQVSLFHNPVLRGVLRHLLPAMANEAIGIQHIKLYVFDDDVIISGANLTKEYFTNRQDRYVIITKCKSMADFCEGLIEKLSSVSLRLKDDNSLEAQCPQLHPFLSPPQEYIQYARDVVWGYYQQALNNTQTKLKPGDDTWVFPLLQLPAFGVLQDSCVTQTLLESAGEDTVVRLTSPYFNPPEKYIYSLLHKCRATFKVLVPHPTAIDFYGAKGFAGYIPSLYSVLTSSFMNQLHNSGQNERISVHEFTCPGMSYHGKGVWLKEPPDEAPSLTIIGSSNFNCRSEHRDLECQMVFVTRNKNLRYKLLTEYDRLYRQGSPISQKILAQPERKPLWWQPLFMWLFKSYF